MSRRDHMLLRIEGMTCDGCARHVTEALKGVSGVEDVQVPGWRSGKAVVIAGSGVMDNALSGAVRKAGYSAIVEERRELKEGSYAPKAEGVDYDLMVIGGGSAGFAAAIKGAELGSRVVIIEADTIGGTCVNIGCVPSKTLIKAAELCYRSAYPRFEGVTACPPPSDWQRIVRQKDELVEALRQGKYINVMNIYPNITLIKGRAELLEDGKVAVNGNSYRPGKVIIATGSRPWAPPIPGLKEAGYMDSTGALSLPELPASLLIIGAGAIGLEIGQLFNRFGVRMMILEGGPNVAGNEDPEIGRALTEYLAGEKIRICTNTKIKSVEHKDSEYRVHAEINGKGETCTAQKLLVATGRRPNTAGFGLEKAGVELGKRGEILVDRHLQTSSPNIYAAGDCIGDPMYVYVAAYAGGLAAENALKGTGRIYDLSALPHVIFTDPQVASVGLTERQAREQGLKVKIASLDLKNVPRAIAARDTRGLIKLVAEEETGRLLGAHVVADDAGEVIQEATLAIRFGLTIKDIIDTFHPYLTMAEGLKLASLTFEKDVTRLSCCAT